MSREMDAKVKSRLPGSIPSSLGRPVGVLPVAFQDRPPLSRGTHRGGPTTTTAPRSAVRNHGHTIPSLQGTSSKERIRGSSGRKGKGKLSRQDSYEGGDDTEQEVKFINVPSEHSSSPQPGEQPRGELREINPLELLQQSQETDYERVYEVNLHASSIGHIHQLHMFMRLRVLDLSSNFIEKINNLGDNQDLREIKFYDNRIKVIENLEKLKELCHLQLHHNKIRILGRGLISLKKLRILRLDSNELLKVEPGELAGCSQITSLDLSNNKLDNLAALNSLPNLEELLVVNNRLRTVGDLNRCRHLQDVDLSKNRLTDISGFKGLPNLHVLNVSENQLTSLKSIGKLKGLRELSVSDNKICSVESFCEQFPNLEILNISNNCLATVKDLLVLRRLTGLVELFMSGNPFCTGDQQSAQISAQIQTALPQLEMLDWVLIKKWSSKSSAPLMRPMSASSIVSIRHVESQMKTFADELSSFKSSFAKRFESLQAACDSLPSESPSRPVSSINTTSPSELQSEEDRPVSRCSSRSRIKLAQEFAAAQQP